jgi:phosphoribosylformylglycinamidine synthase
MVLKFKGETVCDIPLAPLADEAPLYDRPALSREEYKIWAQVKPLGEVPESADLAADLIKLMGSPDLASRRWIWEQYDHMVGADTVQRPGGDAAVVRVHGGEKALAISTDVTPRYCYADPYEGGRQAIAECWRNLSAVGATPLAVTNCLNFANPQRPEIMAQLVGCLEGMSEACRALDFPIVSGNVSLYNESKATGGGSAILPTPAIGGIGLLKDWRKSATIAFKDIGDVIVLIGERKGQLGQSLWLRELHGREDGPPPKVDLERERQVGDYVRAHIESGCLTAVHDVADGGVAVAVAEMALAGNLGALLYPLQPFGVAGSFFAEDQGLYVATVADRSLLGFLSGATIAGIPVEPIGRTIANRLIFELNEGDFVVPLADLRRAHEAFFPRLMGQELAVA